MSSQDPLQSSSARLHVSFGGAHAPHDPALHVSVPVEAQDVVQGRVSPEAHAPPPVPLVVDEDEADEADEAEDVDDDACPPPPPEPVGPPPVPG
jgi:hypothetical protein